MNRHRHGILLFCAKAILANAMPIPPTGYNVSANADCGYPVCQTITQGPGRVGGPCGLYGPTPCNITLIAKICDATPGCEGFNSNGWMKKCLPPRCKEAVSGMETANCNLFVKIGPPRPTPPPSPPVPVTTIEDAYYPVEEKDEDASAGVPVVTAAGAQSCQLKREEGATITASTGDLVFGVWVILAIIPGPTADYSGTDLNSSVVVMERRFSRWGLLVFASPSGEVTRLRKPLGQLNKLNTTSYDFTTAEPDYYHKAAADPHDYIGTRIVEDSEHGEADFLTAAKYLPALVRIMTRTVTERT